VSILIRYTTAPGVTAEKYDEIQAKIEDTGKWPPDGLQAHVAFAHDGAFRVSEVWESQEKLGAFGETVMPILQAEGVDLAGAPDVIEVHNFIRPSPDR
jgi:hypothetical protein